MQVAVAIDKAGYEVVFAGGCVRDALLGRDCQDYDLATNAQPEQVEFVCDQAGLRTRMVGAHFGVVLAMIGDEPIEIATFREDGSYADGRHPDNVYYTNAKEDAKRRDFTINGLFANPFTLEVTDYVGGLVDLEQGVIRAIGDPSDRFKEDGLRLLRAVRFAVQLGFKIEEQTKLSMMQQIGGLQKVSAERMQAEFSKILMSDHPHRGVRMLADLGFLNYFFSEVLELKGCEQPAEFHPEGDVFEHTMLMLDLIRPDFSLELRLAILLHDIGKPKTQSYNEEKQRFTFYGHDTVGAQMAEAMLRSLKYPNDIIDSVVVMVKYHMQFINVQRMRVSTLRRFIARDTFAQEMELHRVDCLSSNGNIENYEFLQRYIEEQNHEIQLPEPLLRGHDLLELGLEPGVKIGQILMEVQTKQLEQELYDYEQALNYVKLHYL